MSESDPKVGAPPARALPKTSRYEAILRIASGGMATVYLGRLLGAAGFQRVVAIKRTHPHLVERPGFRAAILKEAELASRLRHPNVASVLDVEEAEGELLLIMEYVEGASLSQVLELAVAPPAPKLIVRILLDLCAGLQAAHELVDEGGRPLLLVHRDVSPQNALLGVDGLARLSDFGTARVAAASDRETTAGMIKGKLGYMAPEYVETGQLDARSDVFSLGVLAWEALTSVRLFEGTTPLAAVAEVLTATVAPPSSVAGAAARPLDGVVLKALAREPSARYASARGLAAALEAAARPHGLVGTTEEVATFVRDATRALLEGRRALMEGRSVRAEAIATPSVPREAPTTVIQTRGSPDGPATIRQEPIGLEERTGLAVRPSHVGTGVVAAVVVAAILVAMNVVGPRRSEDARRATAFPTRTAGLPSSPAVIPSVPLPLEGGAAASAATADTSTDTPRRPSPSSVQRAAGSHPRRDAAAASPGSATAVASVPLLGLRVPPNPYDAAPSVEP